MHFSSVWKITTILPQKKGCANLIFNSLVDLASSGQKIDFNCLSHGRHSVERESLLQTFLSTKADLNVMDPQDRTENPFSLASLHTVDIITFNNFLLCVWLQLHTQMMLNVPDSNGTSVQVLNVTRVLCRGSTLQCFIQQHKASPQGCACRQQVLTGLFRVALRVLV